MRRSCYPRTLVVLTSAFLSLLILSSSTAYAGAAAAYNGRMGAATSGIIQKKLTQRGFAANDPRYAATITAVGGGIAVVATEVAVTTAVAGIAAVSWPAVLVGAGVTALVGGAITFVANGGIEWLWGNDYDAQLSGDGMATQGATGSVLPAPPSNALTLAPGMYFYQVSGGLKKIQVINLPCGSPCASWAPPAGYTEFMNAGLSATYTGPTDGTYAYYVLAGWVYDSGYTLVYEYRPAAAETVTVGSGTTPYQSEMKAIPLLPADIPDAVMSEPVSDAMLADAANATWKNAADAPLPWSATNPITPADVAQWRAENPASAPTVADFFAPVSNGNTVSLPLPNESPDPSTATPGTGQTVDLGPDPNTPPPTLEPTPTAAMILAPILGLLPDFRAFSLPAHNSQCPEPSFSVFGESYVISSHCDLIEEIRSPLQAVMLLLWTIVAAFIVLRA